MKVIKIALAAIGAAVLYCLLGWLALYLCVILGIWGAVPDIVLIVVLVYAMNWFWQRYGIWWGKVCLGIGMFLVPVIVWGGFFGFLQYGIYSKALEMGWFAGLPIVLECLSAFICSGLGGIIFLIMLWIQRRKKDV